MTHNFSKVFGAIISLSFFGSLGACATISGQDVYDRAYSMRTVAKNSFVAIPVKDGDKSWSLGAVLRVPYGKDGQKFPAVIVVHGSGGVDSRGEHYVNELNKAGYATLEVDLWAARNVKSAAERPKSVFETLPDAYAALNFLNNDARIDGSNVGITGYSWGGVVSMLTAVKANNEKYAVNGQRFAAHAPYYPVCWIYNVAPTYDFKGLTGSPVLIQGGLADEYDAPDTCEKMVAKLPEADRALVKLIMHKDATHAFERREPDAVAFDPYAHLGKGGNFPIRYNAKATKDSTEALLEFFNKNLKD